MTAQGLLDELSTLARRVVASAVSEARRLGHEEVSDEHVLLALAGHEGPASAVLAGFGVTSSAVRQRLLAETPGGLGPEETPEPMSEQEAAELARQLRAQGVPRAKVGEVVERIQRRRKGLVDLGPGLRAVLERALLDGGEPVSTLDLARALMADPSTAVTRVLGWIGPTPDDVKSALQEASDPDPA